MIQRPTEILEKYVADIVLINKPVFYTNYVDIVWKYRDEDEDEKPHTILIESPAEFAAFCLQMELIEHYDVNEWGVRMFARTINTDYDWYGYPIQYVGLLEIKSINTGFTQEGYKMLIAKREYDYGSPRYRKLGIVRQMYPTTRTKQTA